MDTLARTLNRSVRTIQRHIHLLRKLGLIEFVERRRHKGRFSSYLYRVVHLTRFTTGHGRRVAPVRLYKKRTKRLTNTPLIPQKSREEQARRRKEGYEWLFE